MEWKDERMEKEEIKRDGRMKRRGEGGRKEWNSERKEMKEVERGRKDEWKGKDEAGKNGRS